MRSHVGGGPNEGLDLTHVAIVYSLQEIGKIRRGDDGYHREIAVKVKPDSRIVVFAEQADERGIDDAVTMSAKLLHKSVSRVGVGRVIAIGQTRF
jgi:hypothetical protein